MVRWQPWLMLFLLSGLAANSRGNPAREFLRDFHAGTHHSLTGQFIIRDAPPTGGLPGVFGDPTNLVRLEPNLLTVSCERIKKALLFELNSGDNWQGRIFINLHHSDDPDETIVVAPMLIGRDWSYRIELPDLLPRARLVSVVVEVLLLEMAERGSAQSAEIPAWLSQGISRQIMLSSQMELVLEPPHKTENGVVLNRLDISRRRTDPLALAHEDLRAVPPLTLEELSWPRAGQLDGEAGEAFRSSAQLLVSDLFQLPDGRAAMRALLPELSRHLNWQIAFLRAFHADFASQLAFEKWWALQVVEFTGRDLTQNWPREESWRKLEEVLRPEVQVRVPGSDAPFHTQVSLQAVIRDWDYLRQTQLLREKVQQLTLLRMWVSQDLIFLVDEYRHTLEEFIRQRDNATHFSFPMGRMHPVTELETVTYETLQRLDALEVEREKLRPPAESSPPIAVSQAIGN